MPLLGEPPIQTTALAKSLTRGSDLTWESLKQILYNECCEDLVCCHKSGLSREANVQPEWLLDFVSLDRETLAMKLAVESELALNMPQRLDDFEKLMSIKAPLKLFIYCTRNETESADVRRSLEGYLQRFSQHIEGEEYLLMDMDVNQKSAAFHQYRVPESGKIHEISFVPLPLERSSAAS